MKNSYSDWRERLFSALDERLYTIDWLDEKFNAGAKLIALDNSAALVDVATYPNGIKELRYIAAFGEIKTLTEKVSEEAERFAVQKGCSVIKIKSRDAWAKLMEPMGFYKYQQIIEKVL